MGVESFDEHLTQPCLSFLHDPVYMVREKSILILKSLVEQFASEWADRAIVPKLKEMVEAGSYFRRMTVLFVVNVRF